MKVTDKNHEASHKPPPPQVKSDLPEIYLKVEGLPSKGLAYPKDAVIKYRPYTFGEVKKINQSKLDPKSKFEFYMLGIECSFDKSELTVSDLLYVSLLRKISTLGKTDISITIHCKKCKLPTQEHIKVGDEGSKLSFDDIKVPRLPVIITLEDGKDYSFLPLTVKMLFFLLDNNIDIHETTNVLASQCVDHEFKESLDKFESVYHNDGLLLTEVDDLLYHGVSPIHIHCKNKIGETVCNHVTEYELDGGDALLLPFRGDKESTKSRIHFGTKGHR